MLFTLATARSATFLSSSAKISASWIIFSISSGVKRLASFLISIFSLFPVPYNINIHENSFFITSNYLIFSRNAEYTIDVDFEGDFQLRNAASGRWDASQVEFAQNMVIFCHWTFALIDLIIWINNLLIINMIIISNDNFYNENTWIETVCWLSAAVEKIWDFLVGTTEFLGIILVMTPPTVSMPKVNGQTSKRTMPPASSSPERTPA